MGYFLLLIISHPCLYSIYTIHCKFLKFCHLRIMILCSEMLSLQMKHHEMMHTSMII